MHFHQGITLFALLTNIAVPALLTAQSERRDDAAVYAAVTSVMFDSTRASALMIRSVTRPSIGSLRNAAWEAVGRSAEVDSAMANDFKINNMAPRPMPSFAVHGKAVRMITDSVMKSLKESPLGSVGGSDDGWADFRKRFPDASGVLSFGGIGYSADGQYAVVDVNFSFNGTGSGRIVVLHQIGGKWTVTSQRVYLRA